jgi:hypothetical protein
VFKATCQVFLLILSCNGWRSHLAGAIFLSRFAGQRQAGAVPGDQRLHQHIDVQTALPTRLPSNAWDFVHPLLAFLPAKSWARGAFGPAADRLYRWVYNAIAVIMFLPVLALVAALQQGATPDDLVALDYAKLIGNVNALLLGNSGYAPINPPEWIDALRPQVVLVSVSAADKEGLPSPETLELLQGYTVLRTDRNGWIELSTDGKQMWVEVERR